MKFPHSAPRMERYPKAVPPLKHQAMETSGIHPRHVARGDLAGGNIWCCIDLELKWNWELGQVHVIAFNRYLLPRCFFDNMAGKITLAPLAKRGRQLVVCHAQTGRKQSAIASYVRDHGH